MFCVGTTDIDDYASEKDDAWYEDADNDDNDDDVDDDDAEDGDNDDDDDDVERFASRVAIGFPCTPRR